MVRKKRRGIGSTMANTISHHLVLGWISARLAKKKRRGRERESRSKRECFELREWDGDRPRSIAMMLSSTSSLRDSPEDLQECYS